MPSPAPAASASLSRSECDAVHGNRVQAEYCGDLVIRHLRLGFDKLHDHGVRPRTVCTGHDFGLNHIGCLAKQELCTSRSFVVLSIKQSDSLKISNYQTSNFGFRCCFSHEHCENRNRRFRLPIYS